MSVTIRNAHTSGMGRAALWATPVQLDGACRGVTHWALTLTPTPEPGLVRVTERQADAVDLPLGALDVWAVFGVNGPAHGLDGPPLLHLVTPTGTGADLTITTEDGTQETDWVSLTLTADYTDPDNRWIEGELLSAEAASLLSLIALEKEAVHGK